MPSPPVRAYSGSRVLPNAPDNFISRRCRQRACLLGRTHVRGQRRDLSGGTMERYRTTSERSAARGAGNTPSRDGHCASNNHGDDTTVRVGGNADKEREEMAAEQSRDDAAAAGDEQLFSSMRRAWWSVHPDRRVTMRPILRHLLEQMSSDEALGGAA